MEHPLAPRWRGRLSVPELAPTLDHQLVPASALQWELRSALPLWEHPLVPRWWDQPSVSESVPMLGQQSVPGSALESALRSALQWSALVSVR